jgi:hypothetical protein
VNIAQLRDTVTTLLTMQPDLIGSYTLPDGKTIPAVYVVGQKGVPPEWKADGLEVTMRQYPELLPTAGVGIVDLLKQWEVVLVQYNPDGRQIAEAMERMTRRFPDATFRYLPGNDVAYERCRIIIPDREVRTIIR